MSAKVVCPACTFANDEGERFCILCDARLPGAPAAAPTMPTDASPASAAAVSRTPAEAATTPREGMRPVSGGVPRPVPPSAPAARSTPSTPSTPPSKAPRPDRAAPTSAASAVRAARGTVESTPPPTFAPGHPSFARPEDFPNSILRKVAKGETVVEASKEAFVRKRPQSGVTAWIDVGRALCAGLDDALRFKIESNEPGPIEVELHVEVAGAEPKSAVTSLRLDDSVAQECTVALHIEQPGPVRIKRLELAIVDATGDIRLLTVGPAVRPSLEASKNAMREGEPRWEALELEALDRERLAEGLQAVLAAAQCLATSKRVVGASRLRPSPALLALECDDGRRIFLHLPKETVVFGRKKPAREGTGNSIVLRLLPCRSKEEDPIHWTQTMAISGEHGSFDVQERGLHVVNQSRHGIILNGRRMEPDESVRVPEVFVLMLAGVLRLKGRVYAPSPDASPLSLAPGAAFPPPDGFDAARPGPLDCYHLRRVANREEHEYLVLYRNAAIGSSPVCPVRLAEDGIAPIHARLLRHRGCLLITPDRGEEGSLAVNGHRLARDEVAALSPGAEITIGAATLRVVEARTADMIA